MNKYETIFLIKNTLTEEQRKKTIETIKNYINSNGKITKEEDFGERNLAYEIKKNNKAYYYSIEFDAKAESIIELERMYRINDDILKFIVLRKDD